LNKKGKKAKNNEKKKSRPVPSGIYPGKAEAWASVASVVVGGALK
jgi:hypothetical protein